MLMTKYLMLGMVAGLSYIMLSLTACADSGSSSVEHNSRPLPDSILSQVEPYMHKTSNEENMHYISDDTDEAYGNILITIGERQFEIDPDPDSTAYQELKEKIIKDGSIEISCSNYGGFEKVCDLGFSITANDEQITTQSGDVMLYQGDKLVLFYDSNTWDYTRIGRIDTDTEVLVQALSGNDTQALLFVDTLEY